MDINFLKVFILLFINVLFTMHFVFSFCNKITLEKPINKILKYLFYFISFLVLLSFRNTKISILFQTLGTIAITFLYLLIFRKGSVGMKVFSSFSIINIIVSISLFVFVLVNSLNTIIFNEIPIYKRWLLILILDTISKSLMLKRFYKCNINYLTIPSKILCNLTILCCTSILMGVFNFKIYMSITHNIIVLIDYTIIYLALNIITFTIYFTYLREYTEKVSIKNKLNATIALNTYNEESKKTKIEIDILKKDYNNHIQTIYSLYKEDKLEEANNYINALNFKILEISNNFYTKNETIDAILFNKVSICNNHNIKINIKTCIIENLYINDYDLCTLLGNLLDNCIEATLYVEESSREINLKMNMIKNCLVINLSNSSKGNHNIKNNKFISIKKENGHGLGINQIKSIVYKYDGDIVMKAKDDKFKTDIILLNTI